MLCHSLLSLLSYGITNIYFISLIPNFGHLYFYSYKCHWAGDFFYTNPCPDVCFVSVFPFDQGPWKWGSGARREERSKSCMRLTILSTGSRAFRSTVHSHFHLHRPDGTHACFFDGLSRGVLVVVHPPHFLLPCSSRAGAQGAALQHRPCRGRWPCPWWPPQCSTAHSRPVLPVVTEAVTEAEPALPWHRGGSDSRRVGRA